jgi:hypothetical protein
MGDCTRPSRKDRQMRVPFKVHLAGLLIASAMTISSHSFAATSQEFLAPENEATSSIQPSADHEIAIDQVSAGNETATFSARLTDTSSSLAKAVAWRVTHDDGSVLLDTTSTTASVALTPGIYHVEATYGGIALKESFTVLEGNALHLRFVLNAGALRVLPRLKGTTPPDVTSHTRVFSLSGKTKGTLVSKELAPGEMLALTAGKYRIESRMSIGNSIAVTDVKVRPGIISGVEIDHRAGIARLNYVGAADAKVLWNISRGGVVEISDITGLSANIVLQPGDYTAIARIGDETLSATFKIVDGEARDILLGN